MRWREDGRSGKDDMLGQESKPSHSRLEKHSIFLGRDFISQNHNCRILTDEKSADSSNETDGSLQKRRERNGGTVKPSTLTIWLSNTELLMVSFSLTRNCETAESFGTSDKVKLSSSREDEPLRKHRSGTSCSDNDSSEVRCPIDKDAELLHL
jgi:hypothetical protein